MDRRFLMVLAMSLVLALVVSAVVYQISTGPARARSKQLEYRDLVAAAQALPAGGTIQRTALKVTKIPTELFPVGGFSRVEDVIDRPVISHILLGEPVLEGRLAARGSGLGLAPSIPTGMRAVSVRVNDVVSVAGFVLPGMRVDVLVTGRPPNYNGTITTTVLQNILVLSAGQILQSESRGQAINAPLVTLLVTPQQAEILTLANNEGKIQLVLRNSNDQQVEATQGEELMHLYGRTGKVEATSAPASPQPRTAPRARPVERPLVAAAPPATTDEIVFIRGNQKSVEVVGRKSPSPDGKD
ncbi:MAG: Flp pilus assembly protein CpaB [Candidatus Solibacter usitatus]|nr:Flp pilus assembly protein CpaB [Candidatus Solibacter usitatus]